MEGNHIFLVPKQSAYLLYDADCGPCTRFMRIVKLLDFRNMLVPVPLRGERAKILVNGSLSNDELMRSFHIVITDSSMHTRIFSAGDGLIALLRFFPLGFIAGGVFQRIKTLRDVANWSYIRAAHLHQSSDECSMSSR